MSFTHELLRGRFAYVRRHLDIELDRISDADLNWAPSEGMRTIGGQLFEILGKEIELLSFAKARGKEEWVEIDQPDIFTLQEWRDILRVTREGTLAYLDSLSDAGLEELVQFPESTWWEGLYLPAIPMHEIFRNIAAHEWYHTGQIVSYLWSRGENPYARD